MEQEIKHEINDIEEDRREEGESIYDAEKDPSKKNIDDIAEDHRELNESVEDLKASYGKALVEIESLKKELEQTRKERDEANSLFMNSGKESEEKERSYKSIIGDIR